VVEIMEMEMVVGRRMSWHQTFLPIAASQSDRTALSQFNIMTSEGDTPIETKGEQTSTLVSLKRWGGRFLSVITLSQTNSS
jgi:hypothetical protein